MIPSIRRHDRRGRVAQGEKEDEIRRLPEEQRTRQAFRHPLGLRLIKFFLRGSGSVHRLLSCLHRCHHCCPSSLLDPAQYVALRSQANGVELTRRRARAMSTINIINPIILSPSTHIPKFIQRGTRTSSRYPLCTAYIYTYAYKSQ